VALRDPDSVARLINKLGGGETRVPLGELRGDIAGILERYLGLKLDEIPTVTLARDLLDLAVRHKIKVPKEYAVLAKASITLEGLIRRLYPRLDILEVGLPYARELLLSRFNPQDASSVLMKSLIKLQALAEDVPAQMSQILADLEGGKLQVNVRSEDVSRVAERVRSAGLLVFLGLLSSSLALGGLLVVALGPRPGLGVVALSAGLVIALLALVLHVAPPRLSKISVRRFIPRGSPAQPGSPATRAPPPPPPPPPAPPA